MRNQDRDWEEDRRDREGDSGRDERNFSRGNERRNGGGSQGNYGRESGYGSQGGYGNQSSYGGQGNYSGQGGYGNQGGYRDQPDWNSQTRRDDFGSRGAYGGNYGQTTPNYNTGDWSGTSETGSMGSRRGQFTGKGPKGYKRSDDRIREDVSDHLTEDGNIDASDVEVKVQDGEVTLDGTVSDRRQKRLIEDLCEQRMGVKHVQNNLRVKSSETQETGSQQGDGNRHKSKSPNRAFESSRQSGM